MIAGEAVTVFPRGAASGTDAHNMPVLDAAEPVETQAVVCPSAGDDSGSGGAGRTVRYTLHFPKGLEADLDGAEVEVRGERLRICGAPRAYTAANVPGRWGIECEAVSVHG